MDAHVAARDGEREGLEAEPGDEAAQEEVERQHAQQRAERVHAHLLRVPEMVGRDGHQEGRQQPHLLAEQAARQQERGRDEQNAEEEREEGSGELAVAGQLQPDMQQQVVERGMDVAGGVGDQIAG